MEIWKIIDGFDEYEISTYGNIRNINSIIIKNIKPNKYGYKIIGLSKNKKRFRFPIHRLVALNFLKNEYNKPYVNHINGIRDDNNVSNLEWCNQSENIKHSYKNINKKGINNHLNKLSEKEVIEIFYAKGSHQKIANYFNISYNTVYSIKNKILWKHLLYNLNKIDIEFRYLKEEDLLDNRIDVYDELLPYERKVIVDFPNYTIDVMGNVYNLKTKKYKQLSSDKDGYLRVSLYKEKETKTYKIHRLVAKIFISNPENKPIVNHKDGNKENNIVSNLEWVTNSENIIHAIKTGLIK